jgi:hypothetical protein
MSDPISRCWGSPMVGVDRQARLGTDVERAEVPDVSARQDDRLGRGDDPCGYPFCHQGNLPDQEFGWGSTRWLARRSWSSGAGDRRRGVRSEREPERAVC